MFRNLVLSLPKINSASTYEKIKLAFRRLFYFPPVAADPIEDSGTCPPKRTDRRQEIFEKQAISSLRRHHPRSLSPVKRNHFSDKDVVNESLSCSKIGQAPQQESAGKIARHQSRTLCYTQEKRENIKEIKWRDDPGMKNQAEEKVQEEMLTATEPNQYEILEQYELEAARPRPEKNQDVFLEFNKKTEKDAPFSHLQPDQLRPYGSQDNLYSPSLIRPTNSLKYPRRQLRKTIQEKKEAESSYSTDLESPRHRNYCTLPNTAVNDMKNLSTSQTYVGKEEIKIEKQHTRPRRRVRIESDHEKLVKEIQKIAMQRYQTGHTKTEIYQPAYYEKIDESPIPIKFSTAKMREERKKKENSNIGLYYKSSYSDLVKLNFQKNQDQCSNNLTSKSCIGPIYIPTIPTRKAAKDQILTIPKTDLSVSSGQRTITTKSKTNIAADKNNFGKSCLPSTAQLNSPEIVNLRNYSKSNSRKKARSKARKYNPECEDICTEQMKKREKMNPKNQNPPYEIQKCDDGRGPRTEFLPSKVKMTVPPCTPKPDYHCKPPKKCPPRADECLKIEPKKLPYLKPGDCPCIDPYVPTYSPKLEKLCMKFEDPPKVQCHVPPCQTPRADDTNPYKFKPLKPYVPGDCDCVEPPRMTDVKLKRLPRCEPEEVCRPPRICPVIDPCPPRADECLVDEPKRLPPLEDSPCPCIDPPVPNKAPRIRRLNLNVPEPERVCPRPPPCHLKQRADDHLVVPKKKLPKFIPGDCPCEDRPMVDWQLKRLECVDDPEDCVVPDPCKTFPRADWGCWEYSQEQCDEVDEKCIEKNKNCVPPPPPPKDSCDKDPCKNKGLLDYRYTSKRKYSNTNNAIKLFQNIKSQKNSDHVKTNTNYKPPLIQNNTSEVKEKCASKKTEDFEKPLIKKRDISKDMLKLINDLDFCNEKEELLLFKPKDNKKVNYETIQKRIASETFLLDKKISKTNGIKANINKSKSMLTITSRAISTQKSQSTDEKMMQRKKEFVAKKKCRNIKPSMKAMICRKPCPTMAACQQAGKANRPACKVDRVPVCCEKEESPYPAYSDSVQETIKPFTKTPQFNCNRTQYGFYPNFKKEYEPLEEPRDKKKHFSTSAWKNLVFSKNDLKYTNGRLVANPAERPILEVPAKAILDETVRSATNRHPYSTKTFIIRKPVACPKATASKSVCPGPKKHPSCTPPELVRCRPDPICKHDYKGCRRKRISAPFPAFSDCLNEEMEDILTECPLDREKYLRMQPRFMNPPKKPLILEPPPPIQGKIDLLKEQTCLKEKLCIEDEGLTQVCSEFGKPIELLKTKKLIKEENRDCQRMEELKQLGRWPPFTLRQNRHFCSSTNPTFYLSRRNIGTLGLNSILELDNRNVVQDESNRIYIRNYYSEGDNSDNYLFANKNTKTNDVSNHTIPDNDKYSQYFYGRDNIWRLKNLIKFERLNKESRISKRLKRFYTTYRIKHRYLMNRGSKNKINRLKLHKRNASGNSGYKKFKTSNKKSGISNNSTSKFTLNGYLNKSKNPKESYKDISKERSEAIATLKVLKKYKKDIADTQQIENLQPQYAMLPEISSTNVKEFSNQENIDQNISLEYYKRKHGLKTEGITLDCNSFNDYFCGKSKSHAIHVFKNQHRQANTNTNKSTYKCDSNKSKLETVEFLVQEHQCSGDNKGSTASKNQQNDDCEDDIRKLEEACMHNCIKNIPCDLPEEEKCRICREECQKLLTETPEIKEECEDERSKVVEPECPEICDPPPKKCEKFAFECPPKKRRVTTALISSPKLKKSKSFGQIETFFQKLVNYFKARPNCPAPGDWKKEALKKRAEKAASAAGLIVVDPKCLPPDVPRVSKNSKRNCNLCPEDDVPNKMDQSQNDKKSDSPLAPPKIKRCFSTFVQPSRYYSSRVNLSAIEDINRILKEAEAKKKKRQRTKKQHGFQEPFALKLNEKDATFSKLLQMSLDFELDGEIDFAEFCPKHNTYPRTYFGYWDVLPSRENILEKAWRTTIEAYRQYDVPKNYEFFNELFNRVENVIQNIEDSEKLKTENVLRELEEFLEKNSKKNKK
ncbi:uncharacterized protein LOC115883993 isoform X2 [Sitophilus oryzae]|uniref:Uncharacterized protein LOC115883993 isoform X2 n=1 Tax=Sitophilus oryzae TaxID=7048 RepID=A0A6J2Y5K0_SITOR|nr:uncharacterized protein LOC115883993 isoform X2 [Sitophilus oryzae]